MNYTSPTTLTTSQCTHAFYLLCFSLFSMTKSTCSCEIMQKEISFSPPLHLNSISRYLFCHANPHSPKLLDGFDRFFVAEAYNTRHIIPSELAVSQWSYVYERMCIMGKNILLCVPNTNTTWLEVNEEMTYVPSLKLNFYLASMQVLASLIMLHRTSRLLCMCVGVLLFLWIANQGIWCLWPAGVSRRQEGSNTVKHTCIRSGAV